MIASEDIFSNKSRLLRDKILVLCCTMIMCVVSIPQVCFCGCSNKLRGLFHCPTCLALYINKSLVVSADLDAWSPSWPASFSPSQKRDCTESLLVPDAGRSGSFQPRSGTNHKRCGTVAYSKSEKGIIARIDLRHYDDTYRTTEANLAASSDIAIDDCV